MFFFFRFFWVDPADSWPGGSTGSMIGSGFKTMLSSCILLKMIYIGSIWNNERLGWESEKNSKWVLGLDKISEPIKKMVLDALLESKHVGPGMIAWVDVSVGVHTQHQSQHVELGHGSSSPYWWVLGYIPRLNALRLSSSSLYSMIIIGLRHGSPKWR